MYVFFKTHAQRKMRFFCSRHGGLSDTSFCPNSLVKDSAISLMVQ